MAKTDFTLTTADHEYGVDAYAHGVWTPEMTRFVNERGIKSVILNYARGWKYDGLSFLEDLPDIERLMILHWGIEKDSDIHYLKNLRYLQISTSAKNDIDFSHFPNLREARFDWRRNSGESLPHGRHIEVVYVGSVKDKDLDFASNMAALRSLELAEGSLASTHGIEGASRLEFLGLYYLRRLVSLEGVDRAPRLKRIDIQACGQIKNMELIGKSSIIEEVHLDTKHEITSLDMFSKMPKLRKIGFDNKIIDGDMGILLKFPSLERAIYRNRRHYSHRWEEMDSILSKRGASSGDQ